MDYTINYTFSSFNTISDNKKNNDTSEIEKRVALANQFSKAIQGSGIYGRFSNCLFLKSDGTLGACGSLEEYKSLDPEVLTWKKLKQFLILPRGNEDKYPPVIGLTFDGQCMVSDSYTYDDRYILFVKQNIDNYESIKDWKDINEIFNWGKYVIGLKYDGKIVSYPHIEELDSWKNIKKIFVDACIYALDKDGRVQAYGNIKNYAKNMIAGWENIKKIGSYNNCECYGIKNDGSVVYATMDSRRYRPLSQVIDIQGNCAILCDGSVRSLDYSDDVLFQQLGTGYCQCCGKSFLNKVERVDRMFSSSTRSEIERERYDGAIAMISDDIYVNKNGTLNYLNSLRNSVQLFIGDPYSYGKKLTSHVPDNTTKLLLNGFLKELDYKKKQLKSIGIFGNSERKRLTKAEIDRYSKAVDIINHLP